jgi:hypothetical protein
MIHLSHPLHLKAPVFLLIGIIGPFDSFRIFIISTFWTTEHDRIHEVPVPTEDFSYDAASHVGTPEGYDVTFDFPREDVIETKLSFEDINWLNVNSTDARSLNDVSPQEWDRVGKAFLEKELAK